MSQEIRIPDIGDAESVEVVEILVAVGDVVATGDPLIVIESDKASMEVPADHPGVIERIAVAIGDKVTEGQVIALLADSATAGAEGDAAATSQPEGAAAPAAEATEAPKPAAQPAVPAAAAPSVPAEAATEVREIRVPDIGEADHVVVIEIAVSVGDRVEPDDLLIVIESDKASMEIPVGVAGRVTGLHVKTGDEVAEGALLATVESAAAPAAAAPAERTAETTAEPAPEPRATAAAPAPAAPAPGAPAPAAEAAPTAEPGAAPPSPAATEEAEAAPVYAGPAVRRLARELGVPLEAVPPTGPRGRIVKEDVKSFVKERMTAPAPAVAGGGLPAIPEIDFSRFGPVRTEALSRIRARGAENLHRSWVNLPHVTQHDEVDVSDLEAFRRSLRDEAAAAGVKLTPLAFLIKACCQALREFPRVNSSLDAAARNYILKDYYHIGIAVDTEDGLVVPVIRDADRKGVFELAREVVELSDKARNRKLTPADHQGGTFSITSLGAIGGTGFTPIINAPEVAILGVGRLTVRPQWNGEAFVPREMLPLSMSYDHRAINGAEAGRFVARLAQLLGDIRRLAL